MRLVLRDDGDRAAFDRAIAAIGLSLVEIVPASVDVPRHVIAARAGQLVYFVEDHRSQARYLLILGHDPEPLASELRAVLPVLDEPSLRAAGDARSLHLASVAAASAEPDWPSFPVRPRLSRSIHGRLNVADGVAKIILTDWRQGQTMEIDPASWRALELADGTRDRDAIALALAKEGLYRGDADIAQLFSELIGLGAIEDGLPTPPEPSPVTTESTPKGRELEVLPDFSLVCDGQGSCCKFYGSVGFTPEEALRARLLSAEMDLPVATEALFMPGSGAIAEGNRAVALVDGRCVFLDGARCGLHSLAGPGAKPLPCRLYPAMLMDDGEKVRVSLGPECACVFSSIGKKDGSPLVPAGALTLGDVGDIEPLRLADPVALSPLRTATRAEMRAFSGRLSQALARDADALGIAWNLADAIERVGIDAPIEAGPVPIDRAREWLEVLATCARDGLSGHSWRSGSDLSRRVAEWIAEALSGARAEDLVRAEHVREHEQFYLRALAHGHRLAIEGRPLAHGLRDRGTRLLAARAMHAHRLEPVEPSTAVPLALLEAAMRNLSLQSYADAIA